MLNFRALLSDLPDNVEGADSLSIWAAQTPVGVLCYLRSEAVDPCSDDVDGRSLTFIPGVRIFEGRLVPINQPTTTLPSVAATAPAPKPNGLEID